MMCRGGAEPTAPPQEPRHPTTLHQTFMRADTGAAGLQDLRTGTESPPSRKRLRSPRTCARTPASRCRSRRGTTRAAGVSGGEAELIWALVRGSAAGGERRVAMSGGSGETPRQRGELRRSGYGRGARAAAVLSAARARSGGSGRVSGSGARCGGLAVRAAESGSVGLAPPSGSVPCLLPPGWSRGAPVPPRKPPPLRRCAAVGRAGPC